MACPKGLPGTALWSSLTTIADVAPENNASAVTTSTVLRLMSTPRMRRYITRCHPDPSAALELYRWNAGISSGFWETMSHLEVALRNVLTERLGARHSARERPGSWLDNLDGELDSRAAREIQAARGRVAVKRKMASDGQTIAELSFGFWRFLLANQYSTTLWPDLASGFTHAPNRSRHTVEQPIRRLHEFRNRIAHHEPIWNKDLSARYSDILDVLGYIDPELRIWAMEACRVPDILKLCPVTRPHP